MINDRFEYVIVKSDEQLNDLFNNKNLCKVYYDCFHIEIYHYENPSFDEIKATFRGYFETGILLVCVDNNGEVIGFAAAQPLNSSEKRVLSIAEQFGFDPLTDWYHAELGVSEQYKRHGIGRSLVIKLLEIIPADRILMRTQEKNVPSINLHINLGFKIVSGMTYFHSSSMDKRIFLSYSRY